LNNKSNINTSKGKIYLTVVAMASLLVMAFSVNTNSMNVNAIDFGLISKDTNIGSIDNDSLFNCVGAAVTCDNDNTVNNNIAINNGTSQPNGPDCEAGIACFVSNMLPGQFDSFKLIIGESDSPNEVVCDRLADLTRAELFTFLITTPGISDGEANTIINCLIESGFTNLI
jgi:hypothetical protein